jgi:hypothetical protein
MAASLNNPAWLEWMTNLMGGMSRQSYAATFPPHHFYCLLDELPLHLVPQHALRALWMQGREPLFLNPECILCSGEELPGELGQQKKLVSGFALQGSIAWVRDPFTEALLPFWLGPELDAAIRNMRPGEPAPLNLNNNARNLLSAGGILIPESHDVFRRKEWQDAIRESGLLFREKGYAPLSSLIHPFHVAALRRYYRYLIRTGAVHLGDGQSARRYVAYNEPVAQFFHRCLTPTLSALAGEPLKPSYVYMASYRSGAELKKHTDREQCEFSITLCLDFSPEPMLATPWPIRLDTTGGTVTVYQALGDGLAYRGTRLPHYRDMLSEGQTSTSIFFHYVAADFAGSLD